MACRARCASKPGATALVRVASTALRPVWAEVATDTATTLLERDRELAELDRALGDAQDGDGRILLVEAPAGLGKTTLLRTTSRRAAAAGFETLHARASELERDFAYGCVRQLLEPPVARASDAEHDRLFDGAAALSHPLFAPTGAALAAPSADGAFSIQHGLYWLLNNLAAATPVLLVIDDLHWADTESLRFLNYLAPRLEGVPAAVVASTRPGEGDTAEVARLAAGPESTVLRPDPLSAEATAVLCERRLGGAVAPEFAAACREATGGNPFFLEALLREAREQKYATDAQGAAHVRRLGPPAVAQAVRLRLLGRPRAASELVRAMAILGDGAQLAEAAALARVAEDEAARTADLLVSLAILQPAERIEFVHPIVREAVYGEIGVRERAHAHAHAADILAATGASEQRIAAQLTEAEPDGDPVRVALLRRVAADALARGAPAAARSYLRRALAEAPPPDAMTDVLVALGSAEVRLGAPEAVDHLTTAVASTDDPALIATGARQLANALTITGNPDRAVEELEAAIDVVAPQDRELLLILEAERASHARLAVRESRALARTRLAEHGPVDRATPGERMVLATCAYDTARARETADQAAEDLTAALSGGLLLGDLQLDLVGPFYDIVLGLLATDDLDVVESCIESFLADARGRASIPGIAYATSRRGWVAFRRGAMAPAETDAAAAVDLLTSHGIALGIPLAHALLLRVWTEAGELDAAERALRDRGLDDDFPSGPTTNFLLEARALVRLGQGRNREALHDLLEFGRRDERWGAANPLASRWRSHAALAQAALDDSAEARRLAGEDLDRARRWGAPSGIGVALRALALVDDGSAAIERLREAERVLERSLARLEHARALTDLGAALRRANSRAEARPVLERAVELAERCGARAMSDRARTELRAAGGQWTDPAATGADQLTVSERRVAELAAEGRSNPEIAQTLFVTRKTVETHLGRAYRKLGISGRGELERALSGD